MLQVLSTISAGSRRFCQNGAGQPRNVVREGLGWVEPSHAESPGNTVRRNPPIFSAALPMFHPACRARRPKAAQPGPHNAEKAVPGRFAPNCGEGTISVGRSLGFGSRFQWPGRAVWIGVQPCGRPGPGRSGPQRLVGGLGCSLMLGDARLCSLMPFFVL